jgi:ribosomal-protein-alanine N-acetyltransferase
MTAAASRVTVRDPRPEDLASVIRLENTSFSDPWSPFTLMGELEPDALRLPLVAEIDGELVGYLMAWRIVDQLHILNIATDPVRRRRGIATALLLAAAAAARDAGLVEITLEVRRSNSGARSFYHDHGFTQRGVRAGYYSDNNEDALIMSRDLAGFGDS